MQVSTIHIYMIHKKDLPSMNIIYRPLNSNSFFGRIPYKYSALTIIAIYIVFIIIDLKYESKRFSQNLIYLLDNSSYKIVRFDELVNFDYMNICFKVLPFSKFQYIQLTKYDFNTFIFDRFIFLDSQIQIQESYFANSPTNKCFLKNTQFLLSKNQFKLNNGDIKNIYYIRFLEPNALSLLYRLNDVLNESDEVTLPAIKLFQMQWYSICILRRYDILIYRVSMQSGTVNIAIPRFIIDIPSIKSKKGEVLKITPNAKLKVTRSGNYEPGYIIEEIIDKE